jgi:hypothetical protein
VSQRFFTPRPNVVQSEDGYSVEVIPRTTIRYTEGNRTMVIGSEPLVPAGAMALYTHQMHGWDPPHDREPLDSRERTRIIEHIRAAFDFMGWTLEVV